MNRWIAWNVLFRLQERAKGQPTFRILHEMELADRMSASELDQLRLDKLRELLDYSVKHVPYVKTLMQEAGLAPSDIKAIADLQLLPLIRKADVRKNRFSLRSDFCKTYTSRATGGSTGEPLIFDLAKRRIASHVACRQRVSRWWGVSVGDPEIALWGAPVEVTRQDWIRGIRDRFLATRFLSAFQMTEETMSRYLDVLETEPCHQIFGYPSAIYSLCQHAQKENRNLRRLGVKAVFVTGEVLFPYQREFISETLCAPVANGYGGRDSGFIAHDCPQGGMHVMSDAVVVELVDANGRPVAPGEEGEIVVTDLYSHEAPFLRYATGDLAVFSDRKCPCGRASQLLDRISGRSNDSIIAADGRSINSLALIYPVREVRGIERYRIHQKSVDCFHVQIVKNGEFRIEDENRIKTNWSQLLRSPVTVTFEYLPSLPADPSGKFRHVVSDVPPRFGQRSADEQKAVLQ